MIKRVESELLALKARIFNHEILDCRIADDDSRAHRMLMRTLAKPSAEFLEAEDGRGAVALYQAHPIETSRNPS